MGDLPPKIEEKLLGPGVNVVIFKWQLSGELKHTAGGGERKFKNLRSALCFCNNNTDSKETGYSAPKAWKHPQLSVQSVSQSCAASEQD